MTLKDTEDLQAVRELISETFHRGRRNNAAVYDGDMPAMVGGLRILRTAYRGREGLGFACVQRHPETGEYRQIVSVWVKGKDWRRRCVRDTFITPWQEEHP